MSGKEGDLLKRIQLGASKMGARLFRNNSGKTWIGKSSYIKNTTWLYVKAGSVVIEDARRFHAGLGEGSSDLIGWNPVKINRELIGKTLAVFTGIEGKTGKQSLSLHQKNFLEAIKINNGFAVKAKTWEEAIEALKKRSFL